MRPFIVGSARQAIQAAVDPMTLKTLSGLLASIQLVAGLAACAILLVSENRARGAHDPELVSKSRRRLRFGGFVLAFMLAVIGNLTLSRPSEPNRLLSLLLAIGATWILFAAWHERGQLTGLGNVKNRGRI